MSPANRPGKPALRSPKSADAPEHGPGATNDVRSLNATGRQGEVHFFLQRVAGGLYVEREEIPRRGLRTLQSVHFIDAVEFNRWCDGDPVRFEHPLLHVNLKRDGDDLWRIDAQPADG